MATIHKRRLRSGEAVWELTHGTGGDRQRFLAGRTREEADTTLREFKRQMLLHGTAPGRASIANVIKEYAEYLQTNRRRRTVIRYLRVLRTFNVCFLGRVHPDVVMIRDVRPAHVEEFKRKRSSGEVTDEKTESEAQREQQLRIELASSSKRPPAANGRFGWLGRHSLKARVSQRTVNYELRALFTFFHWAIKRNHLFLNPCGQIERFRLPKRALPKFLTSEELSKFFHACNQAERRLFMSILLTGMRKGEIEFLTWEDISFELGVIFIREKLELGWQPKTDERLIPISPVLHDVLVEQLAARTSERWVFANEAGNRDTHILTKLKKICRQATVRSATVHALRHSFGAHLRMAGVSLADIADLLGHKDLATTQIYARVQQDHLRKVVSKLAPLVTPEKTGSTSEMSPENVTQAGIAKSANRKLLN